MNLPHPLDPVFTHPPSFSIRRRPLKCYSCLKPTAFLILEEAISLIAQMEILDPSVFLPA